MVDESFGQIDKKQRFSEKGIKNQADLPMNNYEVMQPGNTRKKRRFPFQADITGKEKE